MVRGLRFLDVLSVISSELAAAAVYLWRCLSSFFAAENPKQTSSYRQSVHVQKADRETIILCLVGMQESNIIREWDSLPPSQQLALSS